eukprot:scaffold13311_cov161-Cylindrotheca_fusiformis.AAC.8
MKFLPLCQWCFLGVAAVEAASIRKRVRSSVELSQPDSNTFTSLFDKDFLNERELEDMSMPMDGMSMGSTMSPTPPTSPTTPPSAFGSLSPRDEEVTEKCGQTALERSRDILSILSFISDPDSLLIVGTPQNQARSWIDDSDEALICADQSDMIEQRYRAAVIYYALEGDSWTTSTGWLDGSSECEWFGVECEGYNPSDNDTFVPLIAIQLDENNLVGELPAELYGLASLQKLLMENNGVAGSISEGIGNLTALAELDLDTNALVGSLPSAIYTLPAITNIDLNANELDGPLSTEVGNLLTLQVLQLEDNNFTGSLPADALLQLEQLAALTLQGNDFEGSLEPLCDVIEERQDEFPNYLSFLFADSCGNPPSVTCSCCTCT